MPCSALICLLETTLKLKVFFFLLLFLLLKLSCLRLKCHLHLYAPPFHTMIVYGRNFLIKFKNIASNYKNKTSISQVFFRYFLYSLSFPQIPTSYAQ